MSENEGCEGFTPKDLEQWTVEEMAECLHAAIMTQSAVGVPVFLQAIAVCGRLERISEQLEELLTAVNPERLLG